MAGLVSLETNNEVMIMKLNHKEIWCIVYRNYEYNKLDSFEKLIVFKPKKYLRRKYKHIENKSSICFT